MLYYVSGTLRRSRRDTHLTHTGEIREFDSTYQKNICATTQRIREHKALGKKVTPELSPVTQHGQKKTTGSQGTQGFEAVKAAQRKKELSGRPSKKNSGSLGTPISGKANRQRVKTKEQIAREFAELERIEKDLAKQRQATSTGGKKPQLRKTFSQADDKGKAAVKAASKLGISAPTGRSE